MRKIDWVAERWLLRYVSLRGFAIPGNETFDAAIRAGGASDRMGAATALDALLRLRLLVQAGPVVMLTREGERAAAEAARFAASLGEPSVPIPDSHLPTVVWAEADFETDDGAGVDKPRETRMLQARPKQEEPMKTAVALERERFSLDDPEAGRKLVANLDARKVRLVFSELCWHFQCESYYQKERLRAFLLELSMDGEVLEVLPNLYCRPALAHGSSGATLEKAAKKIKRIRRASITTERDADAKALLDFAAAHGPVVTTAVLNTEAERLGWRKGRIGYIIQHLRTQGWLRTRSYATYDVHPPTVPESSEGEPAVAANSDSDA